MQHQTAINPVGKTALCVSFLRMWDAQSEQPVGQDYLAHRFSTRDTIKEFGHFINETYTMNNLAARHSLIDQQVREILLENPRVNIISIGSGLETRAFRVNGGHWYEIDNPGLIQYKNQHLPVEECPNPLQRLPCDFSEGALKKVLQGIPSRSSNVFIIEGVFYYLTPTELENTIAVMKNHSPYHRLICDHISREFAFRFSTSFNHKISALGATLHHENDIHLSEFGYQELARASVPLFALRAKKQWLKHFIVRLFLPVLRDGYRVHQFSLLGE